MGLFNWKKKKENQEIKAENEPSVVYVKNDNQSVSAATRRARETFKYFWRELSWEYRRITPAHDFAFVKYPFAQKMEGRDEPVVEHIWVNQIDFNGEWIRGILVSQPNQLTNVKKGEQVKISPSEISDWTFSIAGRTYGGFTTYAMREGMSKKEKEAFDQSWRVNFGESDEILLVYQEKEHPENLVEHPMSVNMGEKMEEFLQNYPDELNATDDQGNTRLVNETIAGNKTSVVILLQKGANRTIKNKLGKTALDYARQLNWEHLIPLLEK
ncbi:MAG: DUF2314 domain-containing protein [Bacteroidia bacterium]|nr:DUF2314 domain-containing protein [Bacteroidia bacterium]